MNKIKGDSCGPMFVDDPHADIADVNWLVNLDAVARLTQPHLDLEELKNVLNLLQELAPPFTPLSPGSPLTWSQLIPPQWYSRESTPVAKVQLSYVDEELAYECKRRLRRLSLRRRRRLDRIAILAFHSGL